MSCEGSCSNVVFVVNPKLLIPKMTNIQDFAGSQVDEGPQENLVQAAVLVRCVNLRHAQGIDSCHFLHQKNDFWEVTVF